MVKAVVGANWGDEGKGKITDMLAEKADIIVRFQGGANAGHTIVNNYGKFALHTLPSGVFYNHTTSVIGNGVALNIPILMKEIKSITDRNVPMPKILVSDRAQMVMPYHILFDQYEEERLGGKSFGSTKSGIAPFYSDKYAKIGFQVSELFDEELLQEKVQRVSEMKNVILEHLYHKPMIDPNKKASTMTESELKTYVDVSHEDGVIESEERKLIYNVFDFSDAHAKDIMIPRINMVTVSLDATYDDVLAVFRDSMYTRLPVYEDDKDNIIGLINIKDFILTEDQSAFHVGNILRDAYYTYEYKKIADLMYEMREKTTNVSFVLNEYGATVGMITLEDLLEEIVGEIRDEYDEDEEELIQKMSEDTYLVEGSMKLDDINDVLGTNLTSEDYDSIGGLIIDCLDRLPEDGEEVTLENGIHLKVQGIDQNRIIKVLMTIPEPNEEHVEHSSETSENHE